MAEIGEEKRQKIEEATRSHRTKIECPHLLRRTAIMI